MGSLSRLLKNTTLLMASNLMTKGLSAVFIIYLADYLQDTGFGQFSFAFSFAAVFIIFSDLGLDALTIRNVSRDRQRSGEYLESVGLLRFGLSLVMVAASLAGGLAIGLDGYMLQVILVAGLSYVFDKMSGLFYALFRAHERMGFEAVNQIAWRVAQVGLGLAAMQMGFSLLEIMLVMLVSSVLKTVLGFTMLLGLGIRPSGKRISQRWLVRETVPFAGYEVANTIYMQISVIFLFLLQSPEDTGWFSAAFRVITVMLLIPSAFDAAIYPLFSRLYERSSADMSMAYAKSIKFSLLGAIPAAVILAILSREFAGLFGSDFANTADCLVIMAAFLPLYTLNMLMKTALWSGGAQRDIAINIWIALGVLATASYFLIGEMAYKGAALALVIGEASFLLLNASSAINMGLPKGRYLAKPIAAGGAMALAAAALFYLGDGRFGTLHIAVLAGLVYALVILLTGAITKSDRKLIMDALSRHRP